MKPLLIILMLVTVFACSKTVSSHATSSVRENCTVNSLNTYFLCQEASSSMETGMVSRKYWIENAKGGVVYEGFLENGNVSWLNDDVIEIVSIPGTIATEQTIDDYTKVYVISEKKMMRKKAYLKSID